MNSYDELLQELVTDTDQDLYDMINDSMPGLLEHLTAEGVSYADL